MKTRAFRSAAIMPTQSTSKENEYVGIAMQIWCAADKHPEMKHKNTRTHGAARPPSSKYANDRNRIMIHVQRKSRSGSAHSSRNDTRTVLRAELLAPPAGGRLRAAQRRGEHALAWGRQRASAPPHLKHVLARRSAPPLARRTTRTASARALPRARRK